MMGIITPFCCGNKRPFSGSGLETSDYGFTAYSPTPPPLPNMVAKPIIVCMRQN